MSKANWEQIKEIFSSALEIDAADRKTFVLEKCGDDTDLRNEVESWLASYAESETFIETPAFSHHELIGNGKPVAGRQFGNYRVIREIGHGGMGAVFLAERDDGEFTQQVAIKIIRQAIAESELINRFKRERQILATLNHPNIAKLLDGGVSDDGLPFLAMEFVEGEAITKFAEQESLNLRERLKLFLKVCSAVAFAHRNLIVHRDLKPSNILVTKDGEPKLLDFGLAKLLDENLSNVPTQTQTAFRALTPAYASPEQIRNEPITTASDIYSLGVVLYELLTDERPFHFEGKSLDEIIKTVAENEPLLPSSNKLNRQLKGDLDNIVLMALRKEPERRYRSVEQFAEDIQRHLDGLPVLARKDSFHYRAGKFIMRHRIAAAAAVIILLTVITGITMTVREKRKADRRFNDVRQLANSLMFEVDSEIQKGPTKGRAMIAKRALEYLDSLALESGSEYDLQVELAAGYLKVGDIQGKPYRPNLGDTAGAEESYNKARVLLESLRAIDPGNLEAQRYLSLAHQSIGRVQQRNSQWEAAYENEGKAVALSEALCVADPNNSQYRSLLADNYVHFGTALYQIGRGATVEDHHLAIEYFRKALAIHSDLSASELGNADYRYAMGVDYEFVGIAFNRLGDMTGDREYYASALENHEYERAINEALAASDPSNAAYRRIVADAYGEIGLSLLKLGRPAEALTHLRNRLGIFESVKASDPTNIEAIRDVVNSLTEIGQALDQLGDLPGALTELRRAVALTQILFNAEPENDGTRTQLQNLHDAVAKIENRSPSYTKLKKKSGLSK